MVTSAPPLITTDHFQVILWLCAARRTASLANSIAQHLLVEGTCLTVTRDVQTMRPAVGSRCSERRLNRSLIIGCGLHRPPQSGASAETAGLRTKRYTNAGLL
jgi:hypothetical protein